MTDYVVDSSFEEIYTLHIIAYIIYVYKKNEKCSIIFLVTSEYRSLPLGVAVDQVLPLLSGMGLVVHTHQHGVGWVGEFHPHMVGMPPILRKCSFLMVAYPSQTRVMGLA